MGQMPRAAALEFTFQQVEEDNSRRTADLLDFLKKTAEICLSDRKYLSVVGCSQRHRFYPKTLKSPEGLDFCQLCCPLL